MHRKIQAFKTSSIILLIFTILLIFIITFVELNTHAGKKEESKYYPLTIFSKVLAHIQSSYVEEVSTDRLIYGAIKGMVESLDPHSSYLSPQEYKTMLEDLEGKFGGVGLEVEFRFGRLVVISPLPGTPSEKAGILSGDEILSIDNIPTFTMNIEDAIKVMRGKPGTSVKLKIRRGEDKVFDVEIERQIIKIQSVEAKTISEEQKTLLISIKVFQEGTVECIRQILDKKSNEWKGNIGGLIIDLRNNPGGLLEQAVYLADEFLSSGIILTTRKSSGEILETEKAHKVGTRSGFPIVVIVNEYTASAAEVFAGALHDNARAWVVGMKTFGKGTIQNIIRLPDGSALKLTTALYATPSGKIIQAEGIEPDFVVPQVEWDPLTSNKLFTEKNLQGHLKPSNSPSNKENKYEDLKLFSKDYQLFMAYQILESKMKEKNSTSDLK